MKYRLLLILLFAIKSPLLFSQKSIEANFGMAANIFYNKSSFDRQHFENVIPITPIVGLSKHWEIDKNYFLTTGINYSRKKITTQYELNEPNIPYNESTKFYNKYDAYNISIGIKKKIILFDKTKDAFIHMGLNLGIVHSSAIGLKSNSSGINGVEDTIFYSYQYNANLGSKKFNGSLFLELGKYLNKNQTLYTSVFVDIPFTTIDNKTSFNSEWEYLSKKYNHQFNALGGVIQFGVKIGIYVF